MTFNLKKSTVILEKYMKLVMILCVLSWIITDTWFISIYQFINLWIAETVTLSFDKGIISTKCNTDLVL